MDRIQVAAEISIGRAVGFGALAVGTVVLGLIFEPVLALKTGSALTLLMALVLLLKSEQARSRPYRRGRSPGHAPDAVVVGYLGHFDVLLARRLFPHVPVVLDHLVGASDTATDRGVGGGARQRLLRRLDDAALAAADVVVVDTDEHRAALPSEEIDRAAAITL